jgi:hypothetical protein
METISTDFDEWNARQDLLLMNREELDLVPYTVKKWVCSVKKCSHFTKIRDYGILPDFYWTCRGGNWIRDNEWFCCSKHNAWFGRMLARFGWDHCCRSVLDFKKEKIIDIVPKTKTKKIYGRSTHF